MLLAWGKGKFPTPSVNRLFPGIVQLCPSFFLKKELIFFLKQPVMILIISSYQFLSCTVLHKTTSLTYITTSLYFPYYSPTKTIHISVSALLCDCSSTFWHLVAESPEDVNFLQHASTIHKAEIRTKEERGVQLWEEINFVTLFWLQRKSKSTQQGWRKKSCSGNTESTGYSLFLLILFFSLQLWFKMVREIQAGEGTNAIDLKLNSALLILC